MRGFHCDISTDAYSVLWRSSPLLLHSLNLPSPSFLFMPFSNSIWWVSLCYFHIYKVMYLIFFTPPPSPFSPPLPASPSPFTLSYSHLLVGVFSKQFNWLHFDRSIYIYIYIYIIPNQKNWNSTKTYPVRSDLLNIPIREKIDSMAAKAIIPDKSPMFCLLPKKGKNNNFNWTLVFMRCQPHWSLYSAQSKGHWSQRIGWRGRQSQPSPQAEKWLLFQTLPKKNFVWENCTACLLRSVGL
jgi:hypothetical protein